MIDDTRVAAWRALHEPAPPPAQLAAIAAAHPEFADAIAAHPCAYSELREWAAATQAALSAPPQTPTQQLLPPMPEAPAAAPALPPMPSIPPRTAIGVSAAAETPIDGSSSAEGADRARRGPRSKLAIGLAAGGLAVLLVGIGAWALVSGVFVRGASSPQAAVEKAIGAAASGDPVALLGALAPSELSAFRPAFETLAATSGDGDVDYLELVRKIGEAGELRVEDVVYDTTVIADGVATVTASDGTITIDGDPDELAAALLGVSADTVRAVEGAGGGRSDSELNERVAGYREELAQTLRDQLPYTFDLAQIEEVTGGIGHAISPWTLVTVEEGGWYISPLLSVAEADLRANVARARLYDESEMTTESVAGLRGGDVPAPTSFSTPEEAASGAARGFAQAARGDVTPLAATLSLPERRLVALYGPARVDEEWLQSNGPAFEFDSVTIDAEIQGDRAEASVDDLAARYTDGFDPLLGGGLRIRGTCWEWTRSGSGFYDEEDYYNDGFSSGSGCVSDWPPSDEFGIDDARIVFVKENGGWVISPLQTAAVAAEEAAERVAELSEQGLLNELWKP